MKLAITFGYWAAQPTPNFVEIAQEAERVGFDSVWTAESWGNDAFGFLTWIAAHTSTIKLGTGVVQLAARTPTATAMAAMTLDHLSNGRVLLGLGVSGPQVVEGWYGRPSNKPLARTREYVEVVRRALRREGPLEFDGEHDSLLQPFDNGRLVADGAPLQSAIDLAGARSFIHRLLAKAYEDPTPENWRWLCAPGTQQGLRAAWNVAATGDLPAAVFSPEGYDSFLNAYLKASQKCLNTRNKNGTAGSGAALCIGSMSGGFVPPGDADVAGALLKAAGKLSSKVSSSCTETDVGNLDACAGNKADLIECLVCSQRTIAFQLLGAQYGGH